MDNVTFNVDAVQVKSIKLVYGPETLTFNAVNANDKFMKEAAEIMMTDGKDSNTVLGGCTPSYLLKDLMLKNSVPFVIFSKEEEHCIAWMENTHGMYGIQGSYYEGKVTISQLTNKSYSVKTNKKGWKPVYVKSN